MGMADKDDAQGLTAIRRRVRLWQIVFFVGLFGAFDTVNIFTTLANRAGDGTLPGAPLQVHVACGGSLLKIFVRRAYRDLSSPDPRE